MNPSPKKSFYKNASLFIFGLAAGAALCWGAAAVFNTEKSSHIALLLSPAQLQDLSEIRSFITGIENGNIGLNSWVRGELERMLISLGEAELYFTAKNHLENLPRQKRKQFLKNYRNWADSYQKKRAFVKQIQNSNSQFITVDKKILDTMLQQYLSTLRKPNNSWDDSSFQVLYEPVSTIIDFKTGRIVGEITKDTLRNSEYVRYFYPYKIPAARIEKVRAFLQTFNREYYVEDDGTCGYKSFETADDGGLFKLYPEIQRLMAENCRIEECLKSVKKYPLEKRRNIELAKIKPFKVKK